MRFPRTRKNFTLTTIKRRLAYCGWQCEGKLADRSRCQIIVQKGRFRCDHVNPDRLNGKNSFDNAQILCTLCDKAKYPRDMALIAKARRVEAAEFRVRIRSGRPLPGGRDSIFKRKIDGSVVLRT
jgi:hypothetical protein